MASVMLRATYIRLVLAPGACGVEGMGSVRRESRDVVRFGGSEVASSQQGCARQKKRNRRCSPRKEEPSGG